MFVIEAEATTDKPLVDGPLEMQLQSLLKHDPTSGVEHVAHLAGQLWPLHGTTAVGLTEWLHSEFCNTSSSPSASLPQYSTLLANPPPHVTLHTPCLNRHLAVIE